MLGNIIRVIGDFKIEATGGYAVFIALSLVHFMFSICAGLITMVAKG